MSRKKETPRDDFYLCPEMHVIACSLLVKVTKCPAKTQPKPPVCNLKVSACIRVIFRLGLGLLFVSSRIIVRDTL